MKMSLRSKVVIYALLVMVAIYFLSPFVYMLFSTFKTSAEAIAYPPSLFPKEWQWENYAKAWDAQPFGKYLLNSVIVTVLNTLGTVLSCSLVAYGFARYNFKGKNILFMILLSTMMIPWDVTMIPQYMEFKAFGWINTLLPLIVPRSSAPRITSSSCASSCSACPRNTRRLRASTAATTCRSGGRCTCPSCVPV